MLNITLSLSTLLNTVHSIFQLLDSIPEHWRHIDHTNNTHSDLDDQDCYSSFIRE